METAARIVNLFDYDKFLKGDNLKRITLTYDDYHKFDDAKMSLDECKEEINDTYEETIRILEYFMGIFMSIRHHDGERVRRCTCVQVIGIHNIFIKR